MHVEVSAASFQLAVHPRVLIDVRRLISCLLAAGAVLAPVTASAQKPPKPPGQQGVTLRTSAAQVTFSQPLTARVSVKGAKAGVGVTLQRRPSTSQVWSDVETKPTDGKGDASFTTRPRVNVYYRALARTTPEQTSAESLVKVAPLVGFRVSDSTPRAGQRVRFSGTVRPRHNGRRVYVQRKVNGGSFVTVRRATLRAATSTYSRYSLRVRVRRTASYRVRILGHADHAMGISRERVLTTHP
jgi:hypothetical protein